MKFFFKICSFSIIFSLFANYSLANNYETINLQDYEIKTLKTSECYSYEKHYSINPEEEDLEPDYLYSDEDVFDNKAGKVFSKFINDKVINNKVNNFSTKLAK